MALTPQAQAHAIAPRPPSRATTPGPSRRAAGPFLHAPRLPCPVYRSTLSLPLLLSPVKSSPLRLLELPLRRLPLQPVRLPVFLPHGIMLSTLHSLLLTPPPSLPLTLPSPPFRRLRLQRRPLVPRLGSCFPVGLLSPRQTILRSPHPLMVPFPLAHPPATLGPRPLLGSSREGGGCRRRTPSPMATANRPLSRPTLPNPTLQLPLLK